MRGVQSGRLGLRINGEAQRLDEGEESSLPDAAVNVAGVYAMLRDDIQTGSTTAPDFEHAVQLTRLVEAVFASSQLGSRQENNGWPQA